MKAVLRAFLLLLVVCALVAGAVGLLDWSNGLSARAKPSRVEEALARSMRSLPLRVQFAAR